MGRDLKSILVLLLGFICLQSAAGQSTFHPKANPQAGAGSIIVQGRLGGLIFGFDIDQNGTQGVLSEAKILGDGTVQAAVETFDQATGTILKVVKKSQTMDDFVTLGIVGNSIGLIEREHPITLFNVQRTFRAINPLSSNQLNAAWTPPIDQKHIITEVSHLQGGTNTAFLATDVSGTHIPVVFSSNVAANTFGPVIQITDNDFNFENDPLLAYNSVTNQAILGHNTNSQFIVPPKIGIVNLTTGSFFKFTGRGLGVINGIAVDSADNVICSTTSFDPAVQFYNLNTGDRLNVLLPNTTENDGTFRGAAVEFDPVHKLFLVAQPFTSTGSSGSSIQVYDIDGTFVESVDGLSFNGTGNVFPVHIALNPAQRTGFVDGPATTVTQIQSFTY